MNVFMDLLTLCNFCILSNVLDPRTYNFPGLPYGETALPINVLQQQKHDYNALSPDDRHYYSYVRGLAINLINWVHCQYIFEDSEGRLYDFTTLSRQYLHRQVRAIVAYKGQAEKNQICRGVPNCSEAHVRRQVALLFSPTRMLEFQGLSLEDLTDDESLAWDVDYTPKKRDMSLAFEGMTECVLQRIDLTDAPQNATHCKQAQRRGTRCSMQDRR
jgi:hypothetical protein